MRLCVLLLDFVFFLMIFTTFEAESLILRPPALHFLKSSVLQANAPAGAFLFAKITPRKKTSMYFMFFDDFC